MKTETSAGQTEDNVKKEETLELSISDYGNGLSNTPEVISIIDEDADDKDFLCKTSGHFRVQSGAQYLSLIVLPAYYVVH